MDNLLNKDVIITALVSLAAGYVVFQFLMYLLPRRLRSENQHQQKAAVVTAHKRRDQILAEARRHAETALALHKEDMEANLDNRMQDLKVAEEELDSQESFASQFESRLAKLEKEYEAHKAKIDSLLQDYQTAVQKTDAQRIELIDRLEQIAETKSEILQKNLVDNFVNERRLESQKSLKDLTEEISGNAKKLANRSLDRLLSRYAPVFVWPKAVNHVDITDRSVLEILGTDKSTLLQELTELTEGVEISIAGEKEDHQPIIKLAGGYGIYKEAARLTLEELLPKHPNNWGQAARVYERHRQKLEQTALKLGRQACHELAIDNMHDEIKKMIGALNWRTSYRQNQYFHSVEVARLAGMLAHELHVDPQLAKRAGILHDIGKGIDYRIEGSHAVISGDYADRFGESRLVCDTVMSHHNDLVLETPLSYVLKSADTLSGARPGARINLEEGYQIRLSAIDQAVRSFPGIIKLAIMNGGREVHIDVNHKRIREDDLANLTQAIARKIEEEVAFPGQIKVMLTRRFEAVAVA